MKIVWKLFISLFERIIRCIRRFGAAIGLFLSFVLASASVAGSFFVSTKPLFGVPLGVLLSAVGCFASGWIFAICLRKVGFLGSRERDTSETLRQQKEKIASLTKETNELRAENNRLANQHIDINTFRPILQLGLVQVDMSITDVKFKWMDDFDDGYISDTQSQYVGILRQSFKAAYGVDLTKLRIHEDSAALRVVGIVPESLGFKDYQSEWLLRSAHKFTLKKIMSKNPTPKLENPTPKLDDLTQVEHNGKRYEIDKEKTYDGCMDLNRTDKYSKKQEDELRDRINNVKGAEFENVNTYIQKMAKGFVEILLAPVKKSIVFDSIPFGEVDGKEEWLTLEDFATAYNNRIDKPLQITANPVSIMCNEQAISQEVKEGK